METFTLDGGVFRCPDLGLVGNVQLIDSLGTDHFGKVLFGAIREVAPIKHLSAFSFGAGVSPRMLLAENEGEDGLSRSIAHAYSDQYWRFDLANVVAAIRRRQGENRWCVFTTASEIPQYDYKDRCYVSAGLTDRISVSHCEGTDELRLNFYSSAKSAFSNSELHSIYCFSGVLLALLRKHDCLLRRKAIPLGSFAGRLRQLSQRLPLREIEVCDGILQGISSEGIALKLGVSVNTVRTYRKRAYARLQISSQNELMRLIAHG